MQFMYQPRRLQGYAVRKLILDSPDSLWCSMLQWKKSNIMGSNSEFPTYFLLDLNPTPVSTKWQVSNFWIIPVWPHMFRMVLLPLFCLALSLYTDCLGCIWTYNSSNNHACSNPWNVNCFHHHWGNMNYRLFFYLVLLAIIYFPFRYKYNVWVKNKKFWKVHIFKFYLHFIFKFNSTFKGK